MTIVDKDGKSDGTIIADSGFVVSRDGFSFPNYGTNLSKDGHCYGMALFTELYYKKELPFSEGEYKTKKGLFSDEELTSYPYNITDSYLKNYNNLYGYKLKSNILKYTFGFPALGEVPPKDLKIVSKDTLMYNTKYLNEIKASGIYDLKTEETGLSAEEQKKKYGMTYKYTNYGLLNEDYMQKYSSVDYNDKQLLNAIYRYHISQHMMPKISSTSNILKEYNQVMVGIFSGLIGVTILTDNTRFIDLIITRVENGEVPYIGGDFTGNGGHAINVISVAQDNTNETLYHLGVYDSNYPGEKRYLTLACPFKNCDIAANAYYENAGETVYILPASLSELIKVIY